MTASGRFFGGGTATVSSFLPSLSNWHSRLQPLGGYWGAFAQRRPMVAIDVRKSNILPIQAEKG